MFSSNQKISIRQCFRLLTFDLLGISTLLVPSFLGKECKLAGILAIVIGTVLMWLYLEIIRNTLRIMNTDLLSYLRNRSVSDLQNNQPAKRYFVIRKLILIDIFAINTILGGMCCFIFSDMIKTYLVQQENILVIMIVILVVSAYSVSGGIESRARLYEIMFYFVLVPLGIMLVIASSQIKLPYLTQIDKINTFNVDNYALNIMEGGFVVFLMYITLFNLLFFPAFIKQKDIPVLIKTGKRSLMLSGAILVATYVVLLGNFGSRGMSALKYPVITLMSTINLKGSFFKRTDAFMLGVWFFTLFAFLNLNLSYAGEVMKEFFAIKSRKLHLIIVTLIFFVVTMAFRIMNQNIENSMGEENMLGKIEKMGLGAVPIFILLSVIGIPVIIGLTACQSKELATRCFPMLMAVDEDEGKVEFSYVFPKGGLKTENGKSIANPNINPVFAEDFQRAQREYEGNVSKETDTNHMKIVLLGEDFLENKELLREMLEKLQQDTDFPRNTYVCVTDEVEDLLGEKDNLNTDLGSYLEEFIENHDRKKSTGLTTVGNLIDEKDNQLLKIKLPYIEVEEENIVWERDYTLDSSII